MRIMKHRHSVTAHWRIFDTLGSCDLHFSHCHRDGVAAQLLHGHFKAHPCARAALVENHRKAQAAEKLRRAELLGFQAVGILYDP